MHGTSYRHAQDEALLLTGLGTILLASARELGGPISADAERSLAQRASRAHAVAGATIAAWV